MTASDELLRRIEQEPALSEALAWPADFEIERRDPVEPVVLPTDIPLRPVAGCGAGGTYFLCGAPDAAARLLAIAASTAPHYVPYVPADGYEPYELLFGQSVQWRQRQNGWPAGSA